MRVAGVSMAIGTSGGLFSALWVNKYLFKESSGDNDSL